MSKKYNNRNKKTTNNSYQPLEPRQLLASVGPDTGVDLSTHDFRDLVGTELIEVDFTTGEFEYTPVLVGGDPNGTPPSNSNTIIDPNVFGSAFTGVVALNPVSGGSSSICTGTLVDPTHIITAGHCVDFNDNGVPDISLSQTSVVFNVTGQNVYSGIASVTAHPNYTGFNNPNVNDDIAVIELNNPAPSNAEIYPISQTAWTSPEQIVLAGYGTTGTATGGYTNNSASFNVKRTGQNVASGFGVDDEGSGAREIFIYDMDGPTSSTDSLNDGLTLGNNTEVIVGGGDSGGPSFAWADADSDDIVDKGELTLFGVNTYSGGSSTAAPFFGSRAGGMVIASYLDFIDDFIDLTGGGPGGSVEIVESGGSTSVVEAGATDSYSIALATNPAGGGVTIRVTGDAQTEISIDGNNYFSLLNVTLTNTTPDEIFVRAVDDTLEEGPHSGTITHQILATGDPTDYPTSLAIDAVAVEIGDDDLIVTGFVGIDFDNVDENHPASWNTTGAGSGSVTITDLITENGEATFIDLTIAEDPAGSWDEFGATPSANTLPMHTASLADIGGQIYSGNDTMLFTYSDLVPNAYYEIYVFAVEGFYSQIQQRITIQGDGSAVTFDQDFEDGVLFVNDQLGDSTRQLSEYAQIIEADAAGNIVITVDPIAGTNDIALAGLAITESAAPPCTEHSQIFVVPVNNGVAVTDAATGTGYMMYSAESVHARFNNLNPGNADHFVAVRFSGGNWQYNNNNNNSSVAWVNFNPVATDLLVADVDFSADTVNSLQGTSTTNNGISSGYATGDLVFIANQWAGVANSGEFGVEGTFIDTDATSTENFITPVNNGVAVTDNASGTGYMMYSTQSVHTRFGGLNALNANHIIAVRFSGGNWQYNDNITWANFTPDASDVLLAEVDFSADTVTSLQGTSSTVNGIASGYSAGDIVITANQWGGVANAGEFGVAGTFFDTATSPATTTFVTPLNNGIAVTDDAIGTGYMMFSSESLHTRFGGLNAGNADHLIAVRHNGTNWQYNSNLAWVNFTPVASDRLLAEVDFSADTVTSMQGTDTTINGVNAGYAVGDLVFTANQWAGSSNSGEFGVTGTYFDTDPGSSTDINITPVRNGVAVTDNATGTGYMMYSSQSVHSRFGGLNALNADHMIAVRLTGSTWQYNSNLAWVNFTPDATDLLVAELDFSADVVTSLQGTSSTVSGIASGYATGDLVITANQWGGSSNAGEFGVAGTFISTDAGCSSNRPSHSELPPVGGADSGELADSIDLSQYFLVGQSINAGDAVLTDSLRASSIVTVSPTNRLAGANVDSGRFDNGLGNRDDAFATLHQSKSTDLDFSDFDESIFDTLTLG